MPTAPPLEELWEVLASVRFLQVAPLESIVGLDPIYVWGCDAVVAFEILHVSNNSVVLTALQRNAGFVAAHTELVVIKMQAYTGSINSPMLDEIRCGTVYGETFSLADHVV